MTRQAGEKSREVSVSGARLSLGCSLSLSLSLSLSSWHSASARRTWPPCSPWLREKNSLRTPAQSAPGAAGALCEDFSHGDTEARRSGVGVRRMTRQAGEKSREVSVSGARLSLGCSLSLSLSLSLSSWHSASARRTWPPCSPWLREKNPLCTPAQSARTGAEVRRYRCGRRLFGVSSSGTWPAGRRACGRGRAGSHRPRRRR